MPSPVPKPGWWGPQRENGPRGECNQETGLLSPPWILHVTQGCGGPRGSKGRSWNLQGNDSEDSPEERPWARPGQSPRPVRAGGSETGRHPGGLLERGTRDGTRSPYAGGKRHETWAYRGVHTGYRQGPYFLLSLAAGCLVTRGEWPHPAGPVCSESGGRGTDHPHTTPGPPHRHPGAPLATHYTWCPLPPGGWGGLR